MDLRALGFTRESVDGADSGLDFIAEFSKVDSFLSFDVYICRAAPGLRVD